MLSLQTKLSLFSLLTAPFFIRKITFFERGGGNSIKQTYVEEGGGGGGGHVKRTGTNKGGEVVENLTF